MPTSEQEQPAALLEAGTTGAGAADRQTASVGDEGVTAAGAGEATGQNPASSIEELRAELASLRSDLERNRNEDSSRAEVLKELEEERRKSRRQRLLDSGAAIALVALAFSLFTYWLDGRRAGEEASQNARRELSELVSQLNDGPVDQAALLANVGEESASVLSGTINARQQIVASQAEQLLDDHPEIARSLDHLVLGQARARNGEYAAAIDQLKSADLLPRTFVVDVAIKHALAGSHFGLRDYEAGRLRFEEALTVGTRYSDLTPQALEWQVINSRGSWAWAEVSAGNCAEAAEQIHLINEAAATTANPSFYGRPLSLQTEQLIQTVVQVCPDTPLQTAALARLATANVIPDVSGSGADG